MIRLVRPESSNKQGMRCKRCSLLFFDTRKELARIAGYCSERCLSGNRKKEKRIYSQAGSIPINKPEKKKKHKKVSKDFYESRQWLSIRYEILLQYGRYCMLCHTKSSREKPVHVDHIKPISKYPDLALNKNNLQVLCGDCNRGKSNVDETDWRPE